MSRGEINVNKPIDLVRKLDHVELDLTNRPPPPAESSDTLDLGTLANALHRQIWLFAIVFSAVVVLAIAITLTQTPRYTAQAQIVLTTEARDQIAPAKSGAGQPAAEMSDRTDTEVQILQSRELADKVSSALELANDPAFLPRAPHPGLFARTVAMVSGGSAAQPAPPSVAEIHRGVVDEVLGSLRVSRISETRAVQISFTSTSASLAARIANEYARQYTSRRVREELDANRGATRFLAKRLDELRAQAQADTQRVQQYRVDHNLLSTSGASLTEQEISSFNQEVATAKAQAAEDEARLNAARAQLRRGSTGDDVGEALSSPVVSGLRAKQAEVSGRLADLQSRYGAHYPDVIKTQSELTDVNAQIQAEIKRVISNLEAKRAVSNDRVESLSASLNTARGALAGNNQSLAGLDDLERRAQASQAVYDSYLNRYKETVAAEGTESPDADVVSWAEPPQAPSSPRLILNLFLGVVLGAGLGFVSAFLAETLFSGITTGTEVEEKLGLPCLADIPIPSSLTPRLRGTPEALVTNGRSAVSEAFKNLRTSLDYGASTPPKVIAITSSLPKEGKSTIVACLGRSMAHDGERVLLIDCDAVQTSLSRRICGSNRSKGLAQLLRGECEFDDVVHIDELTGVHLLPLASARHERGEPLVTRKLLELLEELRTRYDRIIIDTAPVLPIAETRLATALADATIMVAHWRSTPDHAVRASLRLLPSKYVNVVGVVLSRVNMRKQMKYARGEPSYYFKRYRGYYA
jgi:capsular exopolysaccharide synthesis family protein